MRADVQTCRSGVALYPCTLRWDVYVCCSHSGWVGQCQYLACHRALSSFRWDQVCVCVLGLHSVCSDARSLVPVQVFCGFLFFLSFLLLLVYSCCHLHLHLHNSWFCHDLFRYFVSGYVCVLQFFGLL